jgi:hypothetical protein
VESLVLDLRGETIMFVSKKVVVFAVILDVLLCVGLASTASYFICR